MKRRTGFIVLCGIVAAALAPIAIPRLFLKDAGTFLSERVNEQVIRTERFQINAATANLNTSASGTVFVKGEDGQAELIQLVAFIKIDPKDWGGIAFYIPDEWTVASMTSSYPDNAAQSKPEKQVSIWTTADPDARWHTRLEIGRAYSHQPVGGGSGTVVLDLVRHGKAKHEAKTLTIGVEVGSQEKDGIKIMGTDSIEIAVP